MSDDPLHRSPARDPQRQELCCDCNAPTGRAGKAEDNLYAGHLGPYCIDCWCELPEKLAEENDRLKTQVQSLRSALYLSTIVRGDTGDDIA